MLVRHFVLLARELKDDTAIDDEPSHVPVEATRA